VKVHVKKCWPEQFYFVRDGSKPFEWHKEDDCRYENGDLLILLEYLPEPEDPPDILYDTVYGYTGEIEKRRITYCLRDAFGVPEGYVVLGLGKP
jgi:hypothetical protein